MKTRSRKYNIRLVVEIGNRAFFRHITRGCPPTAMSLYTLIYRPLPYSGLHALVDTVRETGNNTFDAVFQLNDTEETRQLLETDPHWHAFEA